MVIEIRPQRPADSAEVHAVIAQAFDDEKVAALWEDLAARPRAASYVAVIGGVVVGHVGLSWGWVDSPERLVDVSVLSPLSVSPEHQRSGVGRALVARAIEAADSVGAPVLFLEGDPDYYARLGFEPAAQHGFTPPSPRVPLPAFQCMLLSAYEPALTGGLIYPDAFWAHDSVGLRGERLERFGL